MKTKLGPLEMKILGYAQMRGLRTVSAGGMGAPLGTTPKRVRECLSRLARTGVIARVRPGLYLVPKRWPPGGLWATNEFAAHDALMRDRGARYRICGSNAFNR